MMRLRAVAVLALGGLLTLPAGLHAQSVTVAVGGELSGVQYENITVPIYADMTGASGEKLGSYTIRVTWDPAVLYYNGFEPGAFANPVVRTDSIYSGVLYVAGVSPGGMDGVFDLIRLTMYMYPSTGTSPVTVTATELSAAGTLTDLLGTMAITEQDGTFCAALGRWGDLDNDGYANSRDALAILSNTVGIDVSGGFTVLLGDVDGDGATNTRDALILLSYAVGIDITGQRVLLTAPGSCGTGVVPTLAVFPDTAALVVGQSVQLQAMASDVAGGLEALTGVNWEVDDPAVASVSPDGVLTGRDSGADSAETAVWAAVGPGVRVGGTVIVRRTRGVWYVNSQVASQRTVQMGSATYPFASPDMAFPYLSEGDTVRIAPGVVDFSDSYPYLYVGAVFIGDTLNDGSRPVLRPPSSGTAFPWAGGRHGELRNLVFRDFYQVVYGYGIRNLVLDNVRLEHTRPYSYGDGLYMGQGVDSLIVTNSEFLGDTSGSTGQAIYVYGGAGVVSIADTRFADLNYEALYVQDVDSVDIRRSLFERISDYAIYAYGNTRPAAVTLVGNRFPARSNYALYAYNIRGLSMSGNYIEQLSSTPIYATVNEIGGSVVTSDRDSIDFRANGYNFLDLENWDTVRVNAMWMRARPDSAINTYSVIRGRYVEFTNSQFLNLTQEGLDIGARRIVVDNSTFTGCATCDWNGATAINATAYPDSGPSVSVTNSAFSVVGEAIWQPNTNSGGPTVIAGNTVDSATYGFRYSSDSAYVADNILSRIRQYGIYADQAYSPATPVQQSVVLRNRIGCALTTATAYGVYATYTPATVDSSVVSDCDYGIYAAYGTSYRLGDLLVRGDSILMPADGSGQYALYGSGRFGYMNISGNVIRRGNYGMYLTPNILAGDTAFIQVDSNAISQTTQYALRIAPSDSVTVVGMYNNIANNSGYGIYNAGLGGRSFTLGRFVGNGNYSVYSPVAGPPLVDATSNWWGVASGPCIDRVCQSPDTGSIYVSDGVDYSSPLAANPTNVPGLAPPAGSAIATSSAMPAAAVVDPTASAQVYERARSDALADAHRAIRERQAAERAAHDAKYAELERARAERSARHPPPQ